MIPLRRHAQQQDEVLRIQEELERWRSLAQSVPDVLTRVKRDGTIEFISRTMPGIDPTTVIGSNVFDYVPPSHHETMRRAIDYVFRTGLTTSYELQGQGPYGRLSWYNTLVGPIFENGKVTSVTLVGRDFTERHEMEQAIHEERNLVATLLDTIATVIVVMDTEGRIVRINRACEQVSGYSFEELKNKKPWEILIAPEFVAPSLAAFSQFLETHYQQGKFEAEWITRSGQKRLLSWETASLHNERGNITHILAAGQDITEKRQAEQIIQRSHEELEAKVRDAVKTRDDFISVASHELKTPLTSLTLQIQMINRRTAELEPVSKGIQKMIITCARQVERLSRLVEDMLDVSRIATGKLEIHPKRIDLCDLVKAVVERHEAEIRTSASIVTLDCPERPLIGVWDPLKLDQVITNLLTNAIKYGAKRPIQITVEELPEKARLSVQDSGMGIAKEDQERIFKLYERAVSSKRFGGLGMGLYISQKIVQTHGGTIHVESEIGQGSKFIVELPKNK